MHMKGQFAVSKIAQYQHIIQSKTINSNLFGPIKSVKVNIKVKITNSVMIVPKDG